MSAGRIPTTANSPLTAKGDLFSFSTAPARLAVGSDGDTIVADASTSTGLRYQAIQTRNCFYNSSFEIWQRGTSFTAAGYTADRWYAVTGGVANRTISRVAGTSQFQYLTRVQRTAGDTNTTGLDFFQSLEIADATQYAGKTVTVSFFARKGADYSGGSSAMGVNVFSGTSSTETQRATTAYPSGAATPLTGSATLTTSLQRFQFTFTFGATVTQFAIALTTGWAGTAGAADYYEVSGVQLEVGSVATNYVRQGGTIQGELAACQRYYFRTSNDSAFSRFAFGSCETTTTGSVQFMLPVTMRVAPTAVEFSNLRTTDLANDYGAPSSVTINTFLNTRNIAVLNVADTGWTAFRPLYLEANNNAAAHLAVTAEL